tara:strand:- start:541 stop:1014 length:474 start_codon:yes stop_codon:yes gene_type:complete
MSKRSSIGIFNLTTQGHAVSYATDFFHFTADHARNVVSSGFTLNGRVRSQYDLVGRYFADTRLQAIQTKLLWPNTIYGREPTVKNKVVSSVPSCLLYCQHVRGRLYDTEHGRVPPRIPADTTSFGFGEILAYRTALYGFHRLQEYVAQCCSAASVTL